MHRHISGTSKGWLGAAAAAVFTVQAMAAPAEQNWATWRGPLLNGVAPSGNPPVEWSETRNVKWKYRIPGFGSSTPIVWDNMVLLQSAQPVKQQSWLDKADVVPQFAGQAAPEGAPGQRPPGDRPEGGRRRGPGGGPGRSEAPSDPHQFLLIAVDRQTGKELWQKVARQEKPHEGHHRDHGFASASPVTDGQHIIAFFGSRGLFCYDMAGNLKWEKDLGDMRTRAGFGEGASPALRGNVVVVNWDHEGEDFIVAFDKASGKELWRNKRDELTTWTTPLIFEHAGATQVVVSATTRIRSYDLHSGKQLWECGGMTQNVIPTPVTGFGMLYAISGFRGNSLLAIKLGRTGDLTDTDAIAWKHNKSTPYVPSPLLYGERLYFIGGNNAMLSCFNAKTGQALYEGERLEGISGVYASLVGASGRVYVAGRDGGTVVLKDSDKLEVLARNKLDDKFDASPAVVGNQLFLRGHQFLYCIAPTDRADAR
jgi:outer membrane protein assembly factor BamB